ncbi:glycosyltransferase family 4 protein [Flavobacterium yafengii]|uniref:Glycosyltransferase family 4 protein n=1 Tax=Flavobacterium yafengii TaxID=3041253 RepID=A0AAW6TS92_9FLAO|nr:glycosyltransferase family 4 protein [Flavobacterium yafengii]MDI5950685.1 glycosyltransferase family 4 protein [Flavobacterium yafengii]
MNPIKIALICNYELLPERVGGMDYFFWMFDAKCKKNGIQVDWFFPNQSQHGDYSKLTIFNSNYQNVENYFLDFCIQNQTPYSFIITHFIELCTPFFKKIKQVSKAKVIAIDHNPRPLGGYPIKKRIEKRVKGALFSRFIDIFVGVSDSTKNELILDFGIQIKNKTSVILNGIDVLKFKRKNDYSSHNKFIVASHLRKEKGIQDLILAVKDLKSYNFTIDIYGKGYYEIELRKMIQNFELEKIITLKGSVSNLNEIYSDYDYLIHPSHGETFCYSVVESLLSGVPVVTTKNQGNVLGLVVENKNGFLFEESNILALKEILENILSGKYLLEDYSEISRGLHDLSLNNMIENHFKLIE